MQSNETCRINAMCDGLTKYAVFITNFIANRQYDIKTLGDTMSSINADAVMLFFFLFACLACFTVCFDLLATKQPITTTKPRRICKYLFGKC